MSNCNFYFCVYPKEIQISLYNQNYTTIEYGEYLKLLDVNKNDLKYNTYFDLSFTRGPRPGEIRAFRIKDYNKEKKQLMVNHTMSKKNELKENPDCNENWFIFNGPTPISSNALEKAKEKYFKLANINKHIKLHGFRHSCATWLYSIGTQIAVISKILRHKRNIKNIYTLNQR